MNDVAPPGYPDDPQPQQPAAASQPPGPAKDHSTRNVVIAAIIALIIGAVGGYFVGHAQGEDSTKDEYKPGQAKYDAIYQAGQQAGQATGQQQGEQQGEAQGQASGEKKGKNAGLEQGKQQGIEEGDVQGANQVFAGYSSWQPGNFYVVEIGQGENGVNYTLENRIEMQQGEQYKLCSDDPNQVCVVSVPPQSGGSGG